MLNPDTRSTLIVSRSNVLKSTFKAMTRSFSPSSKLYIKFSGEIGQDYGGPRREFFRYVHYFHVLLYMCYKYEGGTGSYRKNIRAVWRMKKMFQLSYPEHLIDTVIAVRWLRRNFLIFYPSYRFHMKLQNHPKYTQTFTTHAHATSYIKVTVAQYINVILMLRLW